MGNWHIFREICVNIGLAQADQSHEFSHYFRPKPEHSDLTLLNIGVY